MSSDNIADMLTKVRNASMAKHDSVLVPLSKLKLEIVKIMKNEGFIRNYKVADTDKENIKNLKIFLKYYNEEMPVITGLKRVSKPGLRIYKGKNEIPRILNGLGVVIVSTSKGLLTGQKAKEEGLGGEIICHIW